MLHTREWERTGHLGLEQVICQSVFASLFLFIVCLIPDIYSEIPDFYVVIFIFVFHCASNVCCRVIHPLQPICCNLFMITEMSLMVVCLWVSDIFLPCSSLLPVLWCDYINIPHPQIAPKTVLLCIIFLWVVEMYEGKSSGFLLFLAITPPNVSSDLKVFQFFLLFFVSFRWKFIWSSYLVGPFPFHIVWFQCLTIIYFYCVCIIFYWSQMACTKYSEESFILSLVGSTEFSLSLMFFL